MCDQYWKSFIKHSTNYYVSVLKFSVCEHGMAFTLEINSNAGLRGRHVESCPSIIKHARSRDKLKPLCLYCHSTYGRQTRQNDNLT